MKKLNAVVMNMMDMYMCSMGMRCYAIFSNVLSVRRMKGCLS